MTNITQLEREWKLYKRKEQKPYLIGMVLISILFILSILIFSQDTTPTPKKITQTIELKQQVPIEVKIKKDITPVAVQELTPSFSFMKEITSSKKSKPKNKVYKRVIKHQVKTQKNNVPEKISHSNLTVNASSASSKISSLAERFNRHRDPNLGILVAKQYYKNKDYKKAYFYALEVNTIDSKNEESWLITAKSLYFLKNKDAAIKLLNTYLRKHNSAEAIRIYRAIKQGRLK